MFAQLLGGMDVLVQDDAGLGDEAASLALEEALVRAVPRRPLLRIWQNGACVVIGRGQRMSREVNVAARAASGVPVLRRASGGGTVYHDPGNLSISMAVPGREPGLAGELAVLAAGVTGRLGPRPPIGGRGVLTGPAKVSGLASQVTRDGTLARATLLVTTPAGRVRAYLTPAPPDRHPLDSHRSPALPLCAHDPALDIPRASRRCWPRRHRGTGGCHRGPRGPLSAAGRRGSSPGATGTAHGIGPAGQRRHRGGQDPS